MQLCVSSNDCRPLHKNTPSLSLSLCSDAGDGVLEVYLVNKASGAKLACRLIDNGDGTFLAEVLPPQVGEYATQITYGGVAVPKTAAVQVVAIVDVSKIQVDGLEQSKYADDAGGGGRLVCRQEYRALSIAFSRDYANSIH